MNQRLPLLFKRYFDKTATEAERAELMQLIKEPEARDLLKSSLKESWDTLSDDEKGIISETGAERMLARILQGDHAGITEGSQNIETAAKKIHYLNPGRKLQWIAAAVLLILMTGAYFLFVNSNAEKQQLTITKEPIDVDPGREGAILTLADGTQIILDSLGNGLVANQNGADAVLHAGQLVYNTTSLANREVVYNTITTPRGRQFLLTLPDGTKAWLNAESSIRYPTSFQDARRNVTVTGEVYFEIAQDEQKPFFVKIGSNAEIQVLGTSFNVNAYGDEFSLITTVLTGAVKLVASEDSGRASEVVLKLGEQAIVNRKASLNQLLTVSEQADLKKIMAWKRGFFNMEDASLEEVMAQLKRWYDIEVIYKGNIPKVQFGGEMSKNMKLSGIIAALNDMAGNVELVEGRKVIVGAAK